MIMNSEKNKILTMIAILLICTRPSEAAVVYFEDFDGSFVVSTSAGVHVFDGSTTGSWFSSNNGVDTAGDTLNFTTFEGNNNRTRGAGVWLDTSAWELGVITVEFEVEAPFIAGIDNGSAYIQAYTASGVDATNALGVDIHGNAALASNVVSVQTGTPTFSTIGGQTIIGGTGSVVHTFTYAGEEEIALMFINHATTDSNSRNLVFSIDDLSVSTIPEPSSLLLLGFGSLSFLSYRDRKFANKNKQNKSRHIDF